jgi:hypothetical protein
MATFAPIERPDVAPSLLPDEAVLEVCAIFVALARILSSVLCQAMGTAFIQMGWPGLRILTRGALLGTPVGSPLPIHTLGIVVVVVLSQ